MFPTASGHPQMSGGYIPTIFAKKLLAIFYTFTVLNAVASTEYEGEIKDQGDQVRIRAVPEIDIFDYTKGMNLPVNPVDPGYIDMLIDKAKGYNVPVNLVDLVQSDQPIDSIIKEHAPQQMAIKVDRDVLTNIYADADAYNQGAAAGKLSGSYNLGAAGSPFALTKANVIDKIVECGAVLDEQDVPHDMRWVILPAWACALLKTSDLKDASITGDGQSVLRNGRIGMIDRFEIFNSNNLLFGTDGADRVTNAIFGHKYCLGFASQLTKQEGIPNPNDSGELIRGLQVYGYKVLKPEGIGHLYIKRG